MITVVFAEEKRWFKRSFSRKSTAVENRLALLPSKKRWLMLTTSADSLKGIGFRFLGNDKLPIIDILRFEDGRVWSYTYERTSIIFQILTQFSVSISTASGNR